MIGQSSYNVPFYKSFVRHNATSITASIIDFGVMILLRETLSVYYIIATFCGAFLGGLVAFFSGRNWTYSSKDVRKRVQFMRYIVVWIGSILFNTYGVYFFSEVVGLGADQYIFSRVLTSILVGTLFNFPLQRYFVFK